jgi:hypothetical protein
MKTVTCSENLEHLNYYISIPMLINQSYITFYIPDLSCIPYIRAFWAVEMLDDADDVDDSDRTLDRDGESVVLRDEASDSSDGDGSPGD